MVDVMRQEQRLVKHLRLPQFETSSIRFATFQLNLIVFNRECIAWPSVDYNTNTAILDVIKVWKSTRDKQIQLTIVLTLLLITIACFYHECQVLL